MNNVFHIQLALKLIKSGKFNGKHFCYSCGVRIFQKKKKENQNKIKNK